MEGGYPLEILDIKGLNFTYNYAENPTLKDISLSINEGEFVVLCGATGSG